MFETKVVLQTLFLIYNLASGGKYFIGQARFPPLAKWNNLKAVFCFTDVMEIVGTISVWKMKQKQFLGLGFFWLHILFTNLQLTTISLDSHDSDYTTKSFLYFSSKNTFIFMKLVQEIAHTRGSNEEIKLPHLCRRPNSSELLKSACRSCSDCIIKSLIQDNWNKCKQKLAFNLQQRYVMNGAMCVQRLPVLGCTLQCGGVCINKSMGPDILTNNSGLTPSGVANNGIAQWVPSGAQWEGG